MLRQDQHVDPDEAQEIIRLAARHQSSPLNEGPTVDGLAEALCLEPAEVERLLGEVRRKKAQHQVPQQRQFGDRSAALSAGIVLALVLTLAVIGFGGYLMFGRMNPAPSEPPEPPAIVVGDLGPPAKVRIGPGADIVVGAPAEPGVAPAAPGSAVSPSPSPDEAMSEAARRAAEESLQKSIEALREQAKTLSGQERQDAEDKVQQAEEALKNLREQAGSAASGR
jgi:hypothetical protein